MNTLLIQTVNNQELVLVETFLKQHHLKSRILTNDDKEDIVLGKMMDETNYTETVDTNEFIKQLRNQ